MTDTSLNSPPTYEQSGSDNGMQDMLGHMMGGMGGKMGGMGGMSGMSGMMKNL